MKRRQWFFNSHSKPFLGIIFICMVYAFLSVVLLLDAKTQYSIEVINNSSNQVDLYQDDRYIIDLKPGLKWVCFVAEGNKTTLEVKYYLDSVLQTESDTFDGNQNWTWTIINRKK